MSTRIIVMEVPDARAEDLLRMAIHKWNGESGERVEVLHQTSFPTTDRRGE